MALDRAVTSQLEQAVISKAQALAYTTSGGAVLIAGMTVNEWAAAISAACAVVTCISTIGINFYFKLRAARRGDDD